MGTILASAIFLKAQRLLLDETAIRWLEPELLGWLNSGQREIVLLKPNSCVKNEAVQMMAGTKQALPAGGLVLIDVVRNMGADGATPGRAITGVQRDVLDTVSPDWHSASANAVAKHYVYDVRDPKNFYLYPPQPPATTQRVEIVYSVAPTELTATSDVISVDDIYEGCLIDYLLYRAYSKDAEFAGNGERAVAHFQAFQSALGVKLKGEAGITPAMKFTPRQPAQG